MKKEKDYRDTRFSANVIEAAHNVFLSFLDEEQRKSVPITMSTKIGEEQWSFDSREEFLTEYSKSDYALFHHIPTGGTSVFFSLYERSASIQVAFPSRQQIESVFAVFERNLDASKILAPAEPLRVFIGHGHDPQWRDLKDHLHDQHGIEVTAYEIGPRAGLSVKEVLQDMLNCSSYAFLLLTGEDLRADGEAHARENVIHELGLFQGRLGFTRSVALIEDGVKEFSNILGVNQIRFPKGKIRETFGDVLAVIKRESQRSEEKTLGDS